MSIVPDPGRTGADRPQRVLFVPVSGPGGIGEYARCRIVANALRRRLPAIETPFAISRRAPYLAAVPGPVLELPDTPTRESARMIDIIERLRPAVVVFDNAGRTAQLRAARRVGARTVFISSRAGKRWKAFRWRWMSVLDAHWIAYPAFLAGHLTWWERAKMHLRPGVVVTFLGTVFAEPDDARKRGYLRSLGLDDQPYVLLAPGGGGAHRRGPAAVEAFARAAADIAISTGMRTVLVLGPAHRGDLPSIDGVTVLDAVETEDMATLVGSARTVVLNGGSTLTQALALGRACVATAIADDQRDRIRRCTDLGLIESSPLEATSISERASRLATNDSARAEVERRVAATGLRNGLRFTTDALVALLDAGRSASTAPRR